MKQKSWKFPLRDDYNFSFAIADLNEMDSICKFLGVSSDFVQKCDGIASQIDSGDFHIWVKTPKISTIAHECCHVAFYVQETFGIKDEEFFCTTVEWLTKKCLSFVDSIENKQVAGSNQTPKTDPE
jgi:hypothetical protein